MSPAYQYFAQLYPRDTFHHPGGLWRESDGRWEYLSLLDWAWHPTKEGIPRPWSEYLALISLEHAEELIQDRQRWVTYWSLHAPTPVDETDQPLAVLRRRVSPERIYDEVFGREKKWRPTTLIRDFLDPRVSSPPRLKEIGVTTAERIIFETSCIPGATSL